MGRILKGIPCTTIPELGLYYPHMIPTTLIGVVRGAAG
jgi:hypothetical protein